MQSDPFTALSVENADFLEQLYMYTNYTQNPEIVPSTWRDFLAPFQDVRQGVSLLQTFPVSAQTDSDIARDAVRAALLVDSYRAHGHLAARLDPLNLEVRPPCPDLDPKFHGFKDRDWKGSFWWNQVFGCDWAPMDQVLEQLESAYCGTCGVEFMHLQNPQERVWIQNILEAERIPLSPDKQGKVLEHLIAAELFERVLATKYPAAKRFGLEGGESLIPAL